jgi:putative salt-induced outer membrane protein
MRIRERALFASVMVTMAATAVAQQEEGLSGQVAFGYLATSGNSDNETVNLKFGGEYNRESWHHSLDGQAVRADTGGVTTAESYDLAWSTQYDLSETNYIFGRVAWNRNEFGAFREQTRETFGYGRRFIDSETHRLDGEIGAGFRQADRIDGTSEDESIARVSIDYEWDISETASFSQSVGVESGSDNTYTESVTALSADVWGDFAIVLSYTIRQNSDVPVGTEKRDTFTAVALEYSF